MTLGRMAIKEENQTTKKKKKVNSSECNIHKWNYELMVDPKCESQ